MTPRLQIVIPVEKPGPELTATVESLKAQTDWEFGIILCENVSTAAHPDRPSRSDHSRQVWAELATTGIAELKNPRPDSGIHMSRLEHWNWSLAQTDADWVKILLPGARLEAAYVARLKQRIDERPDAHLIRCDAKIRTEWGTETSNAPFAQSSVTPAELLDYFPAQVDWLAHLSNVAYRREAWRALGGFAVHLPACAALNLNALLALHHGIENIGGCLVSTESSGGVSLNETPVNRVNLSLELCLVMRQLRNYCLAAKQPWPRGGVARGVWRGLSMGAAPA